MTNEFSFNEGLLENKKISSKVIKYVVQNATKKFQIYIKGNPFGTLDFKNKRGVKI